MLKTFGWVLLVAAVAGSKDPAYRSYVATTSEVLPGIEVFLADVPQALRGKRIGLITNQSATDRARTPDIDLIARHKDLKLVALFAPEHGIRGTLAAGDTVNDETDAKTGVPIFSLYKTEDRGPTPEMLKDVEVLVYDLQEVGGRTWTYVSTMALAMQAAAKKGIPFVVLDRPNPIGGEIVEGALLDPKFKSFVGMYPIPARHGMTVGELATLFNQKYGIGANLIVIPAANWQRSQWMDDAGLPWVNPSPNLRSLAALSSYPGTVYFEGTNLSEGRGTDRPFEQIGASWLDAPRVVETINGWKLPGIRFEAITMPVEPTAAKFKGLTIPAIRFVITDRQAYRPVRTALLLIDEIRRQHPREFAWSGTIDRLTGSDKVRLAIEGGRLPALLDEWGREAAEFRESRQPFLLYPSGGDRPQAVAAAPPEDTIDVFDLLRMLRHKEAGARADAWDYRKPMMAFAPVIGAKPSSGVLLGAAGNVAFYTGDPSTTGISSLVASATVSTKKQIALTDRFTMSARGNRWRLEGDHRFQWTSLETYALGTSADTSVGVLADFDFFRLHHTLYRRVRPSLFAGAGLYFDNHTDVHPDTEEEPGWANSPYVTYSEAHGLPLDSQISAGTSVDLLWDNRDSFINADRGWLAKVSYRALFDGFLGGDSSWQKLNLDLRTYVNLSRDRRHRIAVWGFADLVVGGVAPFLDLPSTAGDTYGRSARGYAEGQFRGEKLAYGEVEYRGTLMRNGLLGIVAFLNTTTVSNPDLGESLFDSFAPAGGAGLRLLINKRSKTNLCLDFGFGKQGSKGVYLAVQEAF